MTRSSYADVPGGKRRARYDVGQVDAFAIVDGDGDVYLIPLGVVAGRTSLVLSRFSSYRLPRLAQRHHEHSGVGLTGFEPATPAPPVQCATKLRHSPCRLKDPTRTAAVGAGPASRVRPARDATAILSRPVFRRSREGSRDRAARRTA